MALEAGEQMLKGVRVAGMAMQIAVQVSHLPLARCQTVLGHGLTAEKKIIVPSPKSSRFHQVSGSR